MTDDKETQTVNESNSVNSIDSLKAKTLMYEMMAKANEETNQFTHRLADHYDNITKTAKTSKAMKDSYGNSLLAVGNDDKVESFSEYKMSNDTLNFPLWLALYNDSWVFKRAIDKPAQDEIRCGITINNAIDKAKKDAIQTQYKTYTNDLISLAAWGALFGGSIAVVMFDTFKDKDYQEPIQKNIEKIKKAKSCQLYVTDRWYGVAPEYNRTVSNMRSLDYGLPKFYNITMANGKTYRYRHDYILRYEHRTAPNLIKKGLLQGWGYAEGAHIINELSRDEKLKSSVQSLIDKALIEVIKMSGMRGVFMGADAKNEEQLTKRLEMVNWGRSFNSLTFLDKDDEYQMNSFSGLGGLSDLLGQNMWLIAAALEMQGVLFGDLKSGFSNDSEALERYDETINGRCEAYLRKPIQKFLKFLFIMNNVEPNEKPDFTFNSMLAKKQDKDRMMGIQDYVQLLSQLLGNGILTTKLAAKSLQSFTKNGIIDFGLTDEEIQKIDEDSFSENFDIDIESKRASSPTIGGNANENDN